jgi:hypothetical protein
MKIKLNSELGKALRLRIMKASALVSWLVNEHGFSTSKDILIASLADLSLGGKSLESATFDTYTETLIIKLK